MRLLFLEVTALILLWNGVSCHCPHMMGVNMDKPAGPSAPGSLPEGDNGWDYDQDAAPGILPKEQYVQTTYIYRSPNEQEKRFSTRVVNVLRELRERLGKTARLTIENEIIECDKPTDHFRCEEYPTTGTYNYFVVEDEKTGAAVYAFERKLNEKNDGTIEMALLDALSRHTPSSLIAFASPQAEKEVGFIRALTAKEIEALGKGPKVDMTPGRFGTNELNLVESALLEVRTGADLEISSEKLIKFETQKQFDEALEKHKLVSVLFWSNNHMVSLHTFNLWARTAEQLKSRDDLVLSHVACHENADFCQGLKSLDFQTIVAYQDGQNIGTTDKIGDVEYYVDWIDLIVQGPLIKISDKEELGIVKKGTVLSKPRSAVTVGVFSKTDDVAFRHFKIAAEKLAGRFYLAYFIKEGSSSSITTYRTGEKQKRTDYEGKFDPASIISFITRSTLPNIIDISNGFSTDLLLRQKNAVVVLLAPPTFDDSLVVKLATRQDARKGYTFTRITVDDTTRDVITRLGTTYEEKQPKLVIVNKDKVHTIELAKIKCVEHLWRLVQNTQISEADNVLSTKEPHPLRFLQLRKVNELFGHEDSIVLPDHTLFLDVNPFEQHPPPSGGDTGGCPFMQGGGAAASHDEL